MGGRGWAQGQVAPGKAVELVRLQQHPVCAVYLLWIEQEDHMVSNIMLKCVTVDNSPHTAQPIRVERITTTQHCRQSSLRDARVERWVFVCLSV